MQDIAGWVAPVATMIAAMMTASNMGARVTGWGFIVFTIGSIAWSLVAIGTGQANLLWTNGFLTLVNAVGIWRWLGRQARYEEGGKAAKAKSAAAPVPTLRPLDSLPGSGIVGPAGEPMATIVDGMMRCADSQLVYFVVSHGGIGGMGESLYAMTPEELRFEADVIHSLIGPEALRRRQPLTRDDWPERSIGGYSRPRTI